jgi:hypothetical protein
MMTTPLVPYQQREKYAALLLRRFSRKTLKHWGNQGIEKEALAEYRAKNSQS